jgi:hypothetical protein
MLSSCVRALSSFDVHCFLRMAASVALMQVQVLCIVLLCVCGF